MVVDGLGRQRFRRIGLGPGSGTVVFWAFSSWRTYPYTHQVGLWQVCGRNDAFMDQLGPYLRSRHSQFISWPSVIDSEWAGRSAPLDPLAPAPLPFWELGCGQGLARLRPKMEFCLVVPSPELIVQVGHSVEVSPGTSEMSKSGTGHGWHGHILWFPTLRRRTWARGLSQALQPLVDASQYNQDGSQFAGRATRMVRTPGLKVECGSSD